MQDEGNRFAWFVNAGEDEAQWLEAAEVEDWQAAGAPPVEDWHELREGWGWARREAFEVVSPTRPVRLPVAPQVPELPPVMLACSRRRAAALLDMSVDSLDRYVMPEVRSIHKGSLRLIPVEELRRWVDSQAARALRG